MSPWAIFLITVPFCIAASILNDINPFIRSPDGEAIFCGDANKGMYPTVQGYPKTGSQHSWNKFQNIELNTTIWSSNASCSENCTCSLLSGNNIRISCRRGGYTKIPIFSNQTQALLFEFNPLYILRNFSFMNLAHLKSLSLFANKIRYVELLAFSGLDKLMFLSLQFNDIYELHNLVFQPSPNLTYLDLRYNKNLKNLPSSLRNLTKLCSLTLENDGQMSNIFNGSITDQLDVFEDVPLQILRLQGMGLGAVSSNAFKSIGQLKVLDFSSNNFHKKEMIHIFEGLRGIFLDQLLLNFNDFHVDVLSSDIFSPLQNNTPKLLSLVGCGFTKINTDAFCPISSVQFLDLSYNKLEILQQKSFKCLKNLTEIAFRYTILHTTDIKHSFPFFPASLRVLVMSHIIQRGHYLPALRNFWTSSPELKMLVFTDNYPTYEEEVWPPKSTFKNLSEVENIKAVRNKYIKLLNGTFSGMLKLNDLDLCQNDIRHIEEYAIYELMSLKNISLCENKLTETPCLHNVSNLERIDFAANFISKLLNCTFYQKEKLKEIDLSDNLITNIDSLIYFRLLALRKLMLSSNHLPIVSPKTLTALTSLETIDLSLNPFSCTCELLAFRAWIDSNRMKVQGFSQQGKYICQSPASLNGINLKDFNLKEGQCVEMNLIMVIGVSISVITVMLVTSAGIIYRYRWYIRYLVFLARSKRKKYMVLQNDTFDFDAFLSYTGDDSSWVEGNICSELEEKPPYLKLCLHERDFEIGKVIFESIVESMERSRKVIFVVSQNFLSSQWCLFEMRMAQHKVLDENKDNIILILLEDLPMEKMSSTLRYLIRTRTYIAWTEDPKGQELFWKKLKASLQRPNASVVNV